MSRRTGRRRDRQHEERLKTVLPVKPHLLDDEAFPEDALLATQMALCNLRESADVKYAMQKTHDLLLDGTRYRRTSGVRWFTTGGLEEVLDSIKALLPEEAEAVRMRAAAHSIGEDVMLVVAAVQVSSR